MERIEVIYLIPEFINGKELEVEGSIILRVPKDFTEADIRMVVENRIPNSKVIHTNKLLDDSYDKGSRYYKVVVDCGDRSLNKEFKVELSYSEYLKFISLDEEKQKKFMFKRVKHRTWGINFIWEITPIDKEEEVNEEMY